VIGPRTFSWSKGLHKGLYQWALTPRISVACLNFELATTTEPTYIYAHTRYTPCLPIAQVKNGDKQF
jgi:hypothetical protein